MNETTNAAPQLISIIGNGGVTAEQAERVAQDLVGEYGWFMLAGLMAILAKDLIMNFAQALFVFVGSDFNNDDIIYMRSAVESSDSRLGFLPGDADEKLHYYNLPFMDKLDELLHETTVKKLQKEKRVSIHPVNFARGMSWNSKAIIMDESQNSSMREIVTVLTRIGKYSRAFILADPMQTDLKNGNRGGFDKIFDVFDNEESREMGIETFEFTAEDIVRSELTKFVVTKIAELETI
jgi:phosphate starvation-inducible protein PhoH